AALASTGTGNIVCAQPGGCLPNHIAGKGATRVIKELYANANVVPVDYDPSATRVNQENRIKLMLSTARENLKEAQKNR
ncbi:MAG: 2-hydroxyglutaryl-CoA dehydratase, partial [Clostridia bacterium]|nr:2-hydroxyglutaryl-CoA dehydratase [Clostridia bacterium]